MAEIKTAVLSLLRRVNRQLHSLTISSASGDMADDDICQCWRLIELSSVKRLTLVGCSFSGWDRSKDDGGPLVRKGPFKFRKAKQRELEELDMTSVPGNDLTMLLYLLQAYGPWLKVRTSLGPGPGQAQAPPSFVYIVRTLKLTLPYP